MADDENRCTHWKRCNSLYPEVPDILCAQCTDEQYGDETECTRNGKEWISTPKEYADWKIETLDTTIARNQRELQDTIDNIDTIKNEEQDLKDGSVYNWLNENSKPGLFKYQENRGNNICPFGDYCTVGQCQSGSIQRPTKCGSSNY